MNDIMNNMNDSINDKKGHNIMNDIVNNIMNDIVNNIMNDIVNDIEQLCS